MLLDSADDSSESVLERAFELHELAGNAVGQLLAAAAMLRSYHFEFNNFQPMDQWINRVDQLLRQTPSFPSP